MRFIRYLKIRRLLAYRRAARGLGKAFPKQEARIALGVLRESAAVLHVESLSAWLRAPGHGDRGFRLMATSISSR